MQADGRTRVDRVRGVYRSGFETSEFQPGGSQERWSAHFSDGATADWVVPSWTEIGFWEQEVVVDGLLTQLGSYGHMGACDRGFEIRRIWEADGSSFRAGRPGSSGIAPRARAGATDAALHHEIRALVDQHGIDVILNPAAFQAALEDVLGDTSLPVGVLSVLTDAVRTRTAEQLLRVIDNGGDPEAAVRSVSFRFAQERGGGEPAICAWACAALGYGASRVDEPTMAKFSLGEPPAQWPPGGDARTMPPDRPTGPPGPPGGRAEVTVTRPAEDSPPGEERRTPPPERPRWPRAVVALVAALVALALVAGGITWWLRAADDDPPSSGGGTTTDDGAEDVDLSDVDAQFADLSATITAAVTECVDASTSTDPGSEIDCTLPGGTLTLSRYPTLTDLDAARKRLIDTRAGTLRDAERGHRYYSFDPARTGSSEPAEVYWDSAESLTSAHLVGARVAELESTYEATDPTVPASTAPDSPALIRMATEFALTECHKVHTYSPGEVEESECTLGSSTAYVAQLDSRQSFLLYRAKVTSYQREDRRYHGPTLVCYQLDDDPGCGSTAGEHRSGQIRGYVAGDGTRSESGVLYIDDPSRLAFLEIWGFEGRGQADPDALLGVAYPQY
ncbi:hypothetical protein GCM10022242_32130 [Nocardioides panacisoli]|uniref:Uncharacterized protein n=1 Tax=Nocardioides panacisoli TaxID=627624 RepID=A0ABP7IVW9_9ACTN